MNLKIIEENIARSTTHSGWMHYLLALQLLVHILLGMDFLLSQLINRHTKQTFPQRQNHNTTQDRTLMHTTVHRT